MWQFLFWNAVPSQKEHFVDKNLFELRVCNFASLSVAVLAVAQEWYELFVYFHEVINLEFILVTKQMLR